MKPYALVRFEWPISIDADSRLVNIHIHGYELLSIDIWNNLKAFLKKDDYNFVYCLDGTNKTMKENVIYFTGKDFLEVCIVEYMTQSEYDTFTNILPTYFGEHIFNFLFEEFDKLLESGIFHIIEYYPSPNEEEDLYISEEIVH